MQHTFKLPLKPAHTQAKGSLTRALYNPAANAERPQLFNYTPITDRH